MVKKSLKNLLQAFYSISILILFVNHAIAQTITLSSKDGVEISADLYLIHDEPRAPFIALFHQAGWSRGEYIEIAPKLNQLGFNCIAFDLRSGKEVNGITNITMQNAVNANKEIRYIDTIPDILASLSYIKEHYPNNKIIAWGSSYSAALVLHIAGTNPDVLNGVLSFAPGEYFSKQGKPKTWVKESASNITAPVFITSARNEKKNWQSIYDSIASTQKSSFIPESKGNHGSRALWEQFADSPAYWKAVNQFLEEHFK